MENIKEFCNNNKSYELGTKIGMLYAKDNIKYIKDYGYESINILIDNYYPNKIDYLFNKVNLSYIDKTSVNLICDKNILNKYLSIFDEGFRLGFSQYLMYNLKRYPEIQNWIINNS